MASSVEPIPTEMSLSVEPSIAPAVTVEKPKTGTAMFHDYKPEKSGVSLLTSKESLRATFRMAPSTTVLANTLRRQILVQTPSVGFKTEPAIESHLTITKNTTPLANEMILHRIGMIPVAGDPATWNPDQYLFRLNVTNTTDSTIDVTASDFVVMELASPNDTEGKILPTEQFFPPDPITHETCLITRLRPRWNLTNDVETLTLSGKAMVGTGSMNIRWSPVSQCSYENTLDTNETHQKEMFETWIRETKKVGDETPPEVLAVLRREFDTMEVKRCFLKNSAGEPNDFTFYMESVGIRSNREIVLDGLKACKSLVEKYKDIDTMVPKNVAFRKTNARYSAIDCIFQEEGHTLGNLLQTYLVYNHIEGSKEPKIASAGYKIPHPLRPELVLTLAAPSSSGSEPTLEIEQGIVRYAIAQVSRYLIDFFGKMIADWCKLVDLPVPTDAPVLPTIAAPTLVVEPAPVEKVAPAPAAVPAPVETVAPAPAVVPAPVETVAPAPAVVPASAETVPPTPTAAPNEAENIVLVAPKKRVKKVKPAEAAAESSVA